MPMLPKNGTVPWATKRKAEGPSLNTDLPRLSSSQRGYGAQWQRLRLVILAEQPVCRGFTKDGKRCHEPATEVDHIKPHKGDMELFWDMTNLQGLCKSCHSRKTAKSDGRWLPRPATP